MSIRMIRVLATAVFAAALAACGTGAQNPQFSVNGRPLSVDLYHSFVATEQHKYERTGAQVNWSSASGQRRLANIESSVLRELVHDAVVEQLAAERGVVITPADLEHALAAAEAAFGGPVAFEQNLEQAGVARSEFSAMLRYRLLETRLTQRGTVSKSAIETAVDRAHVVATIGPCAGDRPYPACLTPN